MKIVSVSKQNIKLAVEYLRTGKAVIFPTDTAYALGVDAANFKAVKRLYRIKGRDFKKPVHVVVESLKMARRFAKFDKLAAKLFKMFLPGPLTLVLECKFPRARHWNLLSAGTKTLGLRMPNNRIALALVRNLKRPITATSANLSGGKAPYEVKEIIRQFAGQKHQPDLILDADRLPAVRPSTLVKVANDKIEILRKGPITQKEISKYV